jgi:hypothetical protein
MQAEFLWWVNLLADQTPTVVDKAAASDGNTPQAKRRAAAFGAAFCAHMSKLRDAPGAYGQTGLFELLELREECLREFGFRDVYRWAAVAGASGPLRCPPCTAAVLQSRCRAALGAPAPPPSASQRTPPAWPAGLHAQQRQTGCTRAPSTRGRPACLPAPRRNEKERENAAALEVLPDLLRELDDMAPRARLLSLVEGVLAANIFDWGAKACVQLYQVGGAGERWWWHPPPLKLLLAWE